MKYLILISLFFISCAAKPELTEREAMQQELRTILEQSRCEFRNKFHVELERLKVSEKEIEAITPKIKEGK